VNQLLGDCSLDTLRRRRSWKWTEYPADVIPAWVAEMDFDLAEPVKDAVREAIEAGDCGYPHPDGLGAAYAGFAGPRFGWSPDPGRVYAIPDVMTGIVEVLQEVTPHGSGVLINPPVYSPYFDRLRLAGRRVVEAPLAAGAGGRYELDTDAVDRALAAGGVAAYLLCSPHNPTGRIWSREELTRVAEICTRRGTVLIVDEIHAPLALPGARHVPLLSLDIGAELAGRTFTFTSASKGWNIPALKCGLAVVGDDRAARALERRWDALLASHLAVLATIAAFRAGVPWLDAVCGQLDENRTLLAKLLASCLPTVGYQPPEASFLAWLDCRETGAADPAADILARGRVAVTQGQNFGEQGRGFVRLNLGTSPALLEEITRRMGVAIGGTRPTPGAGQ
jgi:cysteine-S-conjugate beta-lyase